VLPSLAEWIDRIFGPSLAPLAALLRLAAAVAVALAVAAALLRAFWALGAWRYGWEEAPVVRCPACGGVAADPDHPTCPAGHPVRFPPGAALGADWRRRSARWRGVLAGVRGTTALLLAAAAIAAWGLIGPGARRLAAAVLPAAAASLLFSGAIFALLGAISPARRGVVGRLLLLQLAAVLAVGALPLALVASAVDSPEARIVGSVWATPTAIYLEADRGEGIRAGPAVARAEARIVELRLPGGGPIWQGLAEVRAAGASTKWPGERGVPARLLGSMAAAADSPTAFLRERWETLELPVNRKVWIVRRGEHLRFDAREPGDLPARGRPGPL
jgi:hypothetical protein